MVNPKPGMGGRRREREVLIPWGRGEACSNSPRQSEEGMGWEMGWEIRQDSGAERKRGNRKMSPPGLSGRGVEGVRKGGRGTGVCGTGDTGRPAAQGARRAPGLFQERRGGAGGCRAGILSGGGDARRALPRGGLESAAHPPAAAAAASPAGATTTRAERPGRPAAIIGPRYGPRPG